MIDDGVRERSATPPPSSRSQAFAAESTTLSTFSRMGEGYLWGSGRFGHRGRRELEQQLEKAKTKVMRRRTTEAARRSEERRTAAEARPPANGPRQLPKAV